MTANPQNSFTPQSASATGEESLRLIASLPAPAGLEDRVHAALRNAPPSSRVLAWPTALKPQSNWMRTAAAAAIVFVVAGGGWGVYTRVEQNHAAKVVVMPPRIAEPGGFAGAGAKRTPQTLPGPTVTLPAKPLKARPKAAKKPVAANSPHKAADARASAAK